MAKNKFKNAAEAAAKSVEEERLRVSFEYIDWNTEEFFFRGMKDSYYKKLFETITEIKKAKEKDITQQNHFSLSPKSIFNSTTSIKNSFPENIQNKIKEKLFVETRNEKESFDNAKEIVSRAFEVSLSKHYGRLHGFIWNNTFNIVWFDPAHNLYPMKYGVTPHIEAASIKCFSPEENLRLQDKIKSLVQENEDLRIENTELMEVFSSD